MEENNNWNIISIPHSQKDEIDLFVRQVNEFIDVYITERENGKVLLHDKLLGSINDMAYDQYKNEINWRITETSFSNRPIVFDMAQARERNGYYDRLDFLKYHIANAMNSSFTNKGFSKYLKKNILGTWTANNFQMSFTGDGHLLSAGEAPKQSILLSLPKSGTWNISRNMLSVMNEGTGIRTQIVDLIADELLLPGSNGQLFYIMKKAD